MCITNRDLSTKIATVIEVERRLIDRFDERLSRAEVLHKKLGSAIIRLALVKLPANVLAGAVGGAIAAATVIYLLLGGVAQAH